MLTTTYCEQVSHMEGFNVVAFKFNSTNRPVRRYLIIIINNNIYNIYYLLPTEGRIIIDLKIFQAQIVLFIIMHMGGIYIIYLN